MSQNNAKSGQFDRNDGVKAGITVRGFFCKRLPQAMVVVYKTGDRRNCSGILHVSEFPAGTREERDRLFAEAKVGERTPLLKVIEAKAPCGNRNYTSVRLSARKTRLKRHS